MHIVGVGTIGDGFFHVVSPEVAARNRKKRRVIHNRLKGRIPGAYLVLILVLLSLLHRMLPASCEVFGPYVMCRCSFHFSLRAFMGWVYGGRD